MTDAASMLVGTSAVMEEVRALVRQVALSTEPVLLVGEVGTGKHLAARTIHALSARSAAPFVSLNCGALPEALLEHELFGHETHDCWGGAGTRHKPGRVTQAEGGTLFFDEVGELSPASQANLLRLLQHNEYAPLGADQMRKADVRVIASSVRSLPGMVKAGTFREDLFARLSAVQIALPPLRDRLGDLEALVRHFLSKFGPTYGHQNATVTPGALVLLAAMRMFGNVRDMENYVEILSLKAPPGDIVIDEATVAKEPAPGAPTVRPTRDARMEAERQAVEEAMRKAGGNPKLAARILGVSRRTLYNTLEGLGLIPT